jgi:integrase
MKLLRDSGSPKRGLLFHAPGSPDTPLNPQTVSKRFSAMLVAHEVELADPQPGKPPRSMLTIRDLRSLHASIQVYRGAPISVVSRRLGHSDPATTLRRYIGVSTKADQELSRQSGLYHRVAVPKDVEDSGE